MLSLPAPESIHLASDTAVSLSVSSFLGSAKAPFVVFLTGLARPASSFNESVAQFLTSFTEKDEQPGVLTWDRYGQGLSGKQDKSHEAMDVIQTLRELLGHILGDALDKRPLILVGNSNGCLLARLYAQHYLKVRALLLLDSMMADTDFVSILDPRPGEEIDEEEYAAITKARAIFAKIFHPSVPNAEGFNRLHMNKVVPHSNKPVLPGQPWFTVVAHDLDVFAEGSEKVRKEKVFSTHLEWELI